tara:strand:+ start:742 stop:1080 length:339 start_codon:yes stop_codon:yes gene_type:complete
MSDTNNLYIKLVRNEKRESREQPMFVAPPNIEAQKNGKNWTIGAKIGDTWYNQCAFEEFDDQGNPTGGITVRLTPSNTGSASAKARVQQSSFAPSKFAKGQGSGYNKPNYKY